MIASVARLTEFLKKHKRKQTGGLWWLAHNKERVAAKINKEIKAQRWNFGSRTTRIIEGKMMSYFSIWSDRFVEFCLYRYLVERARRKKLIAENYVSEKGKGRFFAIRQLHSVLHEYKFVFKTDIKSYFASIDVEILGKVVQKNLPPRSPLQYLIWQDLTNPYREKGIFQGSSISSFYAWIYLKKLDDFFAASNFFYQRYKDDILILAKEKKEIDWSREVLYSILRKRKLKTRYQKTFFGKTNDPISHLGFRLWKNRIDQSLESKKRNSAFIAPAL